MDFQNEITQMKSLDSLSRHRRRSGGSTSSESSAVLERSLSSADEQVKEDIQELKQRFRATGVLPWIYLLWNFQRRCDLVSLTIAFSYKRSSSCAFGAQISWHTLSVSAGSLKRERSSTEAENVRLKEKVKDLQNSLQAVRRAHEEQQKFHHETQQTQAELEVRFTCLGIRARELLCQVRRECHDTDMECFLFRTRIINWSGRYKTWRNRPTRKCLDQKLMEKYLRT